MSQDFDFEMPNMARRNNRVVRKQPSYSSYSSEDSDEENVKNDELTHEQKLKLTKLIKDSISEFCEMTSAHGFVNIHRSKSILIRLAWILLVILSTGYCVYTVTKTVIGYFEYEVKISYNNLIETPTKFPAVSICNLNPIDLATNYYAFTYLKSLFASSSEIDPNVQLDDDEKAYEKCDSLQKKIQAMIIGDRTLDMTDREKLSFTMDTMLVSCFYNGIKCTADQFDPFYTYEYGLCWTFNGDSTNASLTSKSGPSSGLAIELFVGNDNQQDWFQVRSGAYVIVHNQTNRLPLVNYEGFYIKAGQSSQVAVSRKFYNRIGPPYSKCRPDVANILDSDSIYFKQTVQATAYRQIFCYEVCFNYEFVIKQCSCADPSVPIVDDNQYICQTNSELACVDRMRSNLDEIPISETCGSFCPLECDTQAFNVEISKSEYPTDYYSNVLITQSDLSGKFRRLNFSITDLAPSWSVGRKRRSVNDVNQHIDRNKRQIRATTTSIPATTVGIPATTVGIPATTVGIPATTVGIPATTVGIPGVIGSLTTVFNPFETVDGSMVKQSVAKLSVFYRDMRYEQFDETPLITFESIQGVLGGQFGLFMGFSFITFLELIELVVNGIRVIIRYKRKKKLIIDGKV